MVLAKTDAVVSQEDHWVESSSLVGAPSCKQQAVSPGACFRERKLGSGTESLRRLVRGKKQTQRGGEATI